MNDVHLELKLNYYNKNQLLLSYHSYYYFLRTFLLNFTLSDVSESLFITVQTSQFVHISNCTVQTRQTIRMIYRFNI